jgi:hypothetical protein
MRYFVHCNYITHDINGGYCTVIEMNGKIENIDDIKSIGELLVQEIEEKVQKKVQSISITNYIEIHV